MAVTKNILPRREYQVWTSANMSAGDILGVYESLGNRVADSVTFESAGGSSRVRFNVTDEVYREQGQLHSGTFHGNTGTRGPYSTALHHNALNNFAPSIRQGPYKVGEWENTLQPDIIIANGTTQTWTINEIGIRDIRVVDASGLRITVT